MIEKFVDIETPAGRMDAFIAHPEGAARPAVAIPLRGACARNCSMSRAG
jgi:dienelactone hydrolase